MIDELVVQKVAQLSRLELSETEEKLYLEQLNAILQTMDVLKSIDTENITPLAHVLPLKNVTREDTIVPGLAKEKALVNAPNEIDGMFGVPKIV